VVGERHELHEDPRPGRLDAEPPQGAQRLRLLEGAGVALEVPFGPPPEGLDEEIVEGREVVVDERSGHARLARHPARAHRRVPLGAHQLLGHVQQDGARLRALGPGATRRGGHATSWWLVFAVLLCNPLQ
jgi:hypothetical protein